MRIIETNSESFKSSLDKHWPNQETIYD